MTSLLKPTAKTGLNKAGAHELYASNMYKNLANCMQAIGYFNAQKYFLAESADELVHYQNIADYMNDRGDMLDFPGVEKMVDRCTTLKSAFEVAYEAEYELGLYYSKLYEQMEKEGDCVTEQFLLQFIKIQRQSVGAVKDILAAIKLCGNDPSALFMVEAKLI